MKLSLKERDMYVVDFDLNISSEDWVEIEIPITIQDGVQALFLEFRGEGSFDMLEFVSG